MTGSPPAAYPFAYLRVLTRVRAPTPLLMAIALVLCGPAAGCLVVEKHVRSQTAPACHPSQYWDGTQCRHKGQGHGARKHDGEGDPKGKAKGKK